MALVGIFASDPATDDGRAAGRHHLQLNAEVAAGGNAARVLIHNLSATGLLFEAALDLDVGERFEVDLPHAGTTGAQIVWHSDDLFGCQFATPVSDAAVSAARLRSMPARHAPAFVPPVAGIAEDPACDPSPALSPRQKLLVIAGLAIAAWVPVVLAILYF